MGIGFFYDDTPRDIEERLERFGGSDAVSDADLETGLRELFEELAAYERGRRKTSHDQTGYFAKDAGSPECLALGHAEPERYDENDQERESYDAEFRAYESAHPYREGNIRLCAATAYGAACTTCEGECEQPTPTTIWALPGVSAEKTGV